MQSRGQRRSAEKAPSVGSGVRRLTPGGRVRWGNDGACAAPGPRSGPPRPRHPRQGRRPCTPARACAAPAPRGRGSLGGLAAPPSDPLHPQTPPALSFERSIRKIPTGSKGSRPHPLPVPCGAGTRGVLGERMRLWALVPSSRMASRRTSTAVDAVPEAGRAPRATTGGCPRASASQLVENSSFDRLYGIAQDPHIFPRPFRMQEETRGNAPLPQPLPNAGEGRNRERFFLGSSAGSPAQISQKRTTISHRFVLESSVQAPLPTRAGEGSGERDVSSPELPRGVLVATPRFPWKHEKKIFEDFPRAGWIDH